MLDISKQKFKKISKNEKARPSLKIFSRAISSHLISFRFWPFSGPFQTVPEHQKWLSGSRKIWFNRRKKNRGYISRGIKDFFGSVLKFVPLEIFAWFFYLNMNHIFLLSGNDFWCFGTVRKCPDNSKNRKEINCLLMAVPKIFGIGRAFLFLEIF